MNVKSSHEGVCVIDFLKLVPAQILQLTEISNQFLSIFPFCSDKCFPSKKIEEIAKYLGVKEIKIVSSTDSCKDGQERHAFMNPEKTVIYLNEKDDKKHHVFSIAHEICHILFDGKIDQKNLEYAARSGMSWCIENMQKEFFNEQHHQKKLKQIKREMLYDYISALILTPLPLFLLHEDKSDEELSDMFEVPEASIRKRRLEIEKELDIIDNPPSVLSTTPVVLTLSDIEQELKKYEHTKE